MIIISFEGLDKSGKKSQSELLYKALLECGYKAEKSEFHRYDTPTGQLIRQFLNGEYQPGQFAIETIMAADKYAQLTWFNNLFDQVDVLILDRYLTSQCVYSVANGIDIDFTLNLLQYMPPPHFQFYLDINPEESMNRKGEHGENDKYENNKQLLENVRELYLRYMNLEVQDHKALIIDGMMKPEEIHQLILAQTLKILEKEGIHEYDTDCGYVERGMG